jgi:hypothetical protein
MSETQKPDTDFGVWDICVLDILVPYILVLDVMALGDSQGLTRCCHGQEKLVMSIGTIDYNFKE